MGWGLAGGLDARERDIRVDGYEYTDLATAAARFGMKAYWLRGHETVRMRSRWTTIDVPKGGKEIELNGMPVHLGFPTVLSGNRLYLAKADYHHVLVPILAPQLFADPPELKRIFIDPGHGGHDSGARNPSSGQLEKTLTLDVAERLAALLRSAGYRVELTRRDDRFLPLRERSRMANRARADLFLSLHFNAADNTGAAGFETFALTPQFQASSKFRRPGKGDDRRYPGNDHDPWNMLLGYHVQKAMVDRLGGPDRGLKRARWAVLLDLECPGVLVELGFVSHADTARKLRSEPYRQTLAQSVFDGIVGYRQRLDRIR